jgi:hypothetical protein
MSTLAKRLSVTVGVGAVLWGGVFGLRFAKQASADIPPPPPPPKYPESECVYLAKYDEWGCTPACRPVSGDGAFASYTYSCVQNPNGPDCESASGCHIDEEGEPIPVQAWRTGTCKPVWDPNGGIQVCVIDWAA